MIAKKRQILLETQTLTKQKYLTQQGKNEKYAPCKEI